MKCIRLLISCFRVIIISFNMLFVGGFYLLLCVVVGHKWTSKMSLTWLWGKIFLWSTNSKLIVVGKENIPKDKGAIFLFSHSSYMDVPALCASKKGEVNFAAKSFLLKYPILGFIMRAVKTIVIYPDRAKSIEQYKLAEKRLNDGATFMISPEGGRSHGEELLPFKSGPFIFAMNAKADMIPVLIYGAHHIWPQDDQLPNMRRLCGKIYIEYFPKISGAGLTDENRKQQAEEIRLMMDKRLKFYQNKKINK